MITQTYYISTGAKNAMYTLRQQHVSSVGSAYGCSNHYICNLAATEELAVSKAEAYFAAIMDNLTVTDDLKITLDTDPEFQADARNGKMSIDDTRKTETIEAGLFPFGKYYQTKISDAPDSYIMYFADMLKDSKASTTPVTQCLAYACMGIALERGLIAKREAIIQARLDRDSLSNYIGEVAKRQMFTGVLEVSIKKESNDGSFYWLSKIYCGSDVVIYMGSKELGTKGETITIKATVKKHSLYNGCKSTQVSRPA